MAVAEIRPDWTVGTLTLVGGSKDFTTTGSALETAAIQAGDSIITSSGLFLVIAAITGQNSGTLMEVCPVTAAGADQPLRIRFQPDGSRYNGATADLIQLLGSGNVYALAELNGSSDKLPMFSGAGTFTLVDKNDLINGVKFDAMVDTLAELSAYDNEVAGFTVLVADVGDGRSAIYVKNSVASADWSAPAYLTGPKGDVADITIGTTTTLNPGESATVTNSGTPQEPVLDFGIPAGEGFISRGDYSPATAYVKGDVVQYNGSSWIALQNTTGNPPPALPITGDANWSLLAQAGAGGDMYKSTYDPTGQERDIFAAIDERVIYNWIINGDFTINQRGGVKKPANGVYGYDRWKGHADGIEQIIEALPAGEYTLTWSGGGTGTFGGVTSVSPIKVTVAGGNTSVVVPETATKVSVVAGDATALDPFSPRHIQQELALCQRYYQQIGRSASPYAILLQAVGIQNTSVSLNLSFAAMRIPPTGTKHGTWGVLNMNQPNIIRTTIDTVSMNADTAVSSTSSVQFNTLNQSTYISLDAEF